MNILCLILFISSSNLYKWILELIDSQLEFVFNKNTCHCTFRYHLKLQTHCFICKVLYVKLFIKTIPHIIKKKVGHDWVTNDNNRIGYISRKQIHSTRSWIVYYFQVMLPTSWDPMAASGKWGPGPWGLASPLGRCSVLRPWQISRDLSSW